MLKGVNRSVIIMRADRSSRFEAVYFVVKKRSGYDKADVLKEASRIVEDCDALEKCRRASGRGAAAFAGILIGFALSSLIWLTVIFIAF